MAVGELWSEFPGKDVATVAPWPWFIKSSGREVPVARANLGGPQRAGVSAEADLGTSERELATGETGRGSSDLEASLVGITR